MRPTEFRWNDWNLEHATKHGISVEEAERVVRRSQPRRIGDRKWLAEGRGAGHRVVRVIFVVGPDDHVAYIIHAMPLTTRRRR